MSETVSSSAALRRLRPVGIMLGCVLAAVLYGIYGAKLGVGAPLILVALGGLAAALCGLALYRMMDPLLRPEEAARAEAASAPARVRELEREKMLVLKAIREIEHDFQMRRINDSDHKTMIERYRARALGLMRDIDAGGDFGSLIEQELKTRLAALESAAATASPTKSATTCTGCATDNDPDARFCKKCGKAMAGAAGAAQS
jgi:hypothetical protein